MYKCQDIWACALDINPQIKVDVRINESTERCTTGRLSGQFINEAGNVYMKAVIAAWF